MYQVNIIVHNVTAVVVAGCCHKNTVNFQGQKECKYGTSIIIINQRVTCCQEFLKNWY